MSSRESNAGWPWLVGKFYGLIARNPTSNRVVVELADLRPDDRVLDIGCGAGKALMVAAREIGAERVTGVDPTEALVDTARKRLPGAQVDVAMAEDLPYADGTFTVVWSIASHHHWEDSSSGLEEVRRVLTEDGRFLLAERLIRRPGGHGLTDEEARSLAATLEGMGFRQVRIVRRRAGWQTLVVLISHRSSE